MHMHAYDSIFKLLQVVSDGLNNDMARHIQMKEEKDRKRDTDPGRRERGKNRRRVWKITSKIRSGRSVKVE